MSRSQMVILFFLLPGTFLVILLTLRLTRWASNYFAARKIGLPILISPFSWQDPFYMLFGHHLSLLRYLPFGLGAWTQYSEMGWQLQSGYDLHHRFGPAFTIVSPWKNEIIVADPTTSEEVVSRWKVWIKSPELYAMFNVFGKNVNSVNGEDWQRHRKITGPAFKESNCSLVWDEGLRQSDQMCRVWERSGEITLRRLMDDAALLAMHILSSAGFGRQYDFDGEGLEDVEGGHEMSYGRSLKIILHNIMAVILFSGLKAPAWLLPKSLKELKAAITDFKKYMVERVTVEREQKDEVQDNLMSLLVRANESAKNEEGGRMVLSDDELYGNLFMFNLAGHETVCSPDRSARRS